MGDGANRYHGRGETNQPKGYKDKEMAMDVEQSVTFVEEDKREKESENRNETKRNKNKISKQKVYVEHDEREGT